jgi:hypothetical protein
MKEVLTEEERRRRRNEASRRCYLKRKAAQAAAQAAKNPKPKARAVEAKPAPRPAPKKGDPVAMAEKIVKKFAKTAAGVKPMLAEAAELLKAVYPAADQKTTEKVERILAKGLGVKAVDDGAKTRAVLTAASKAVKTPAFRLAKPAEEPVEEPAEENAQFVPFPDPDKLEDEDPEPAEVPLDPETIEKIDAGEIAAEDAVKNDDFDEEDEDETDEEDEDKDDEDKDEDDEEDEDARRERDERRIDDDWASGRWDMMREMDAQGSFDD